MVEETEKEKDDVLRQKRTGQKRYVFDAVFDEDSTQVKRQKLIYVQHNLLICFIYFIVTRLRNTIAIK